MNEKELDELAIKLQKSCDKTRNFLIARLKEYGINELDNGYCAVISALFANLIDGVAKANSINREMATNKMFQNVREILSISESINKKTH